LPGYSACLFVQAQTRDRRPAIAVRAQFHFILVGRRET
jgi:hypothetical protein